MSQMYYLFYELKSKKHYYCLNKNLLINLLTTIKTQFNFFFFYKKGTFNHIVKTQN